MSINMLRLQVNLQEEALKSATWHSCLNCGHFGDSDAKRKLANLGLLEELQCMKYKAKPPLNVIVVGCESWEDGIPF